MYDLSKFKNPYMQTKSTMSKLWFLVQKNCDKACLDKDNKCEFSDICPHVNKEVFYELEPVNDRVYLKSMIVGGERFKDLIFEGNVNDFFAGLTVGSFLRLSDGEESMFVQSNYISSFVVDESKEKSVIKLVKGE